MTQTVGTGRTFAETVRDLIAAVAPEESPYVDVLMLAKSKRRRGDRMLGFGADLVPLVTPIVVAVLSAVAADELDAAIGAAKARTAKLFHRKPAKPNPDAPMNQYPFAEAARIAQTAVAFALILGLDPKHADLFRTSMIRALEIKPEK